MGVINNLIGFETQGFEEASAIVGSPDPAEFVIVRSGSSALRLSVGSTDAYDVPWVVVGGPAIAVGGFLLGFAFYFDSDVTTTGQIFDLDNATPLNLATLRINTSNQLEWLDSTGTLRLTSSALTADQWYYIEIYWQPVNSNADSQIWVDGVSEDSDTSGDYFNGDGDADIINFDPTMVGPSNIYIDDIYCLSGVSRAGGNLFEDRLGGSTHATCPRVLMFQHEHSSGQTPDASGDGTGAGDNLNGGGWSGTSETPLQTTGPGAAQYDSNNVDGSVDLLGPGRKFSGPYYFDTSDAGPQDDEGVWTNDSNAFNGSTANFADTTTSGSVTNNELRGEGTNAPSSGGTIINVYARVYSEHVGAGSIASTVFEDGGTTSLLSAGQGDSEGWGPWNLLNTHSGGWTWAKIQALEVALWQSSGDSTDIYRVEIIVEESQGTKTLANARSETLDDFDWLQADPDGDANIVAMKGIWHAERDNGSDPGFTNYVGNDGGAAADMVSANPVLTTAALNYFLVSSDVDALPKNNELLRQGIGKGSGGRDYHLYEMWAMLLVCPNIPDGDLALLSDTDFPDQNYFVGPFEA